MPEKSTQQAQAYLEENGHTCALISHLPTIRWLTGFSGSRGICILTPATCTLLIPELYKEQAKNETTCDIAVTYKSLTQSISEDNLLTNHKEVLFEEDHMTVKRLLSLQDFFSEKIFVPQSSLFSSYRAQKTQKEITSIKEAQRITDTVFTEIRKDVQPGISERDLAAKIVYEHLRRGADKMSFDPIVASGENSSNPHARPTNRVFQKGDIVVIDMGCFFDGYASDMTRTVCVGEPSQTQCNVYNTF